MSTNSVTINDVTYSVEAGISGATAWSAIPGTVAMAVADDTTPSVVEVRTLWFDTNTVPIVITQLDDGIAGQEVYLIGTSVINSPSIVDGGNFKLAGNYSGGLYSTIHLITIDGSTWVEISRSTN